MKIAFISDIHSNHFYLERVLRVMDREGVEDIYCLGDLIGYHDSPREVIRTCRSRGIRAVRGNHEHYLLGLIDYDGEKEDSYRIQLQRAELGSDDIDYLLSLPDFLELKLAKRSFYLTHSLPGNCIDYLTSVKQLDTGFVSGHDYFCFGHTHRPLIHYHFGCCILNPGSIGQPRDYSRKPSFIVVDLNEETVKLIKVEVDHLNYSSILRAKGYGHITHVLERTPYEKHQHSGDGHRRGGQRGTDTESTPTGEESPIHDHRDGRHRIYGRSPLC